MFVFRFLFLVLFVIFRVLVYFFIIVFKMKKIFILFWIVVLLMSCFSLKKNVNIIIIDSGLVFFELIKGVIIVFVLIGDMVYCFVFDMGGYFIIVEIIKDV